MIGAVFENVIGGYLHPRASVRRILAGSHDIQTIVLLVLFAFLVRQIVLILLPMDLPNTAPSGFGRFVGGLIGTFISFAIITALICYIGRAFGGQANFQQSALAVAWYEVVTSPTSPIVETAALRNMEAMRMLAENPDMHVELSDWAAMVALLGGLLLIWLYAAFIAELHGFRRTLGVMAVLFAILILPAMLMAPALMS